MNGAVDVHRLELAAVRVGKSAHAQNDLGHSRDALLTVLDGYGHLFQGLLEPLTSLAYLRWTALDLGPNLLERTLEKHADTYRYMGQEMPDNLKLYYPDLI